MNIFGVLRASSLIILSMGLFHISHAQRAVDINSGYDRVLEQAKVQCAEGPFKRKYLEYDCHCLALEYVDELRSGNVRSPFHHPKSILKAYQDKLDSACKAEALVYVTGGKGPKSLLVVLENSNNIEEQLTQEEYRGPLSACALLDHLHLDLSSEWFLKEGGLGYSLRFFEPTDNCKN